MNEYRPAWKLLLGSVALIAVIVSAFVYARSNSDLSLFFPLLATASAANAAIGFAWLLFHKYLWKWEYKGWRVLGWIAPQPNFNGRWVGVLDSPHSENLLPLAVEIRQSFTSVDCQIWTGSNRSYTIASSLLCSPESRNFRLLYTYQASSNPGKESDGHIHKGTVIVELKGAKVCSGSRMTGTYFTDRDIPADSNVKKASGNVFLTFESRTLIDDLGKVDPEQLKHLAE